MKIQTNLFGLVYKNHNGKYTRQPYQRLLFTSLNEANMWATNFASHVKKNLKPVRITLNTIE